MVNDLTKGGSTEFLVSNSNNDNNGITAAALNPGEHSKLSCLILAEVVVSLEVTPILQFVKMTISTTLKQSWS